MSALLSPDKSLNKVKLKIELPEILIEEMARYMSHAKINTQSSLIQKALEHVMEKDKYFKQAGN